MGIISKTHEFRLNLNMNTLLYAARLCQNTRVNVLVISSNSKKVWIYADILFNKYDTMREQTIIGSVLFRSGSIISFQYPDYNYSCLTPDMILVDEEIPGHDIFW